MTTKKPTPDIKVFISSQDSVCSDCGEALGRHAWIMLQEDKTALCLACADLDHLVFLPSGDAALTRRARKHSKLSAVVIKWSRARKHFERQGLLVEEAGLQAAETQCLSDSDVRTRRRAREAEKREALDREYVTRFAAYVRETFPDCPAGREQTIAEHACRKYSGRVGRSAAAKQFDKDAVHLAVAAHIRHQETNYDELLSSGHERSEARMAVRHAAQTVLDQWNGRCAEV
jgi:hypothetical protein